MYLIYCVDEFLHVVPKETTDRIALMLTEEDHLDQGGELMQGERASDQTSTR